MIKSVIESTLLVTALIVIAVIIGLLATGGTEQKLLRRIYILLSDHQARLGPMECVKNRAICLSEDKKFLFFIRKTTSGYESNHVDLSMFLAVNQVALPTDAIKDSAFIDSILFSFKPVRLHQPDMVLRFFDPKVDVQAKDEGEIAQRWITNITSLLSKSVG